MTEILATSGMPVSSKSALLDFDPNRHGFGFANVFTWTEEDVDTLAAELSPILKGVSIGFPMLLGRKLAGRPGLATGLLIGMILSKSSLSRTLVRGLARQWPTFGLCGGMALLTKERWERKSSNLTTGLQRESLRPILRLYQARTLRASWPRFLKYWIQAHAKDGVSSLEELSQSVELARKEIDGGRLVVLGLVGDTPDPFAMHQVVAFGYEHHADVIDFHVYDPNAPGRTRHIVVTEKEGRARIETDLPTGPKKSGGYHISKTVGSFSMLFVVGV